MLTLMTEMNQSGKGSLNDISLCNCVMVPRDVSLPLTHLKDPVLRKMEITEKCTKIKYKTTIDFLPLKKPGLLCSQSISENLTSITKLSP